MIYFSAALSSSNNISISQLRYEHLASKIEDLCNQEVYLPHKKFSPKNLLVSDDQVFQGDISSLKTSSSILAILDEPSLGVGAEIAIGINLKIPIMAFSTVKVSRFVVGLINQDPISQYYLVREYDDIPLIAKKFLESIIRE